MNKNLFNLDFSKINEYIDINLLKEYTVGQFINKQLENKEEWGSFVIEIIDGNSNFEKGYYGFIDNNIIFKKTNMCEYKYGKIITEPFLDFILNKKIKNIWGYGGCGYSVFCFEI